MSLARTPVAVSTTAATTPTSSLRITSSCRLRRRMLSRCAVIELGRLMTGSCATRVDTLGEHQANKPEIANTMDCFDGEALTCAEAIADPVQRLDHVKASVDKP